MAQFARDYKDGIFVPALDFNGGLQDGMVVVQGAPDSGGNPQAILPSGSTPWLTPPYGINSTAGFVGGTGTSAGEALTIKRQGLGRVRVTNGNAITRGGMFIADSAVLGNVIPYTSGSFSAWILGTFEETKAASSTDDLAEAYINPSYQALAREIVVSQPLKTTTVGAGTTAYGASTGAAFVAAPVALYQARFAGETVRNLRAELATAPGGTDTLIATVYTSTDGGNNYTARSVTCTITGTAIAAADLVNTRVLSAGEIVAVQVVSSAGVAAGCCIAIDIA